MWALLDVSAWGIRYADRALELGRADASTAGIIVAVGGPVTLLATAAFKIYAETIGKKPVEDDQ